MSRVPEPRNTYLLIPDLFMLTVANLNLHLSLEYVLHPETGIF